MTQHANNSIPADTSPETTIRLATPQDRPFLIHLQRKFSDQLGFLPTAALDQLIAARTVVVRVENGQPAGMIVWKAVLKHDPRACPILQTAVELDAQNRHHGEAMIDFLESHARAVGSKFIQAWVAADIPDHGFFRAVGFAKLAERPGGDRRKRDLYLYRRPIDEQSAWCDIRPDPRHRSPGGLFAPAPQPHQLQLFPDLKPPPAMR